MAPTNSKPAAAPTDDQAADVPALPAPGTLVRLDDPADEGEPRYALTVPDGVCELGPARRHEIDTYPVG